MLTGFVAELTFSARRADTDEVLWLALIWVALIALWGASEHWDLAGAGRRVARSVHLGAGPDDDPRD